MLSGSQTSTSYPQAFNTVLISPEHPPSTIASFGSQITTSTPFGPYATVLMSVSLHSFSGTSGPSGPGGGMTVAGLSIGGCGGGGGGVTIGVTGVGGITG